MDVGVVSWGGLGCAWLVSVSDAGRGWWSWVLEGGGMVAGVVVVVETTAEASPWSPSWRRWRGCRAVAEHAAESKTTRMGASRVMVSKLDVVVVAAAAADVAAAAAAGFAAALQECLEGNTPWEGRVGRRACIERKNTCSPRSPVSRLHGDKAPQRCRNAGGGGGGGHEKKHSQMFSGPN